MLEGIETIESNLYMETHTGQVCWRENKQVNTVGGNMNKQVNTVRGSTNKQVNSVGGNTNKKINCWNTN